MSREMKYRQSFLAFFRKAKFAPRGQIDADTGVVEIFRAPISTPDPNERFSRSRTATRKYLPHLDRTFLEIANS